MSGKRAKMKRLSYIKQNSIAEIVSTMELFLVAGVKFEKRNGVICYFAVGHAKLRSMLPSADGKHRPRRRTAIEKL